ncbi:MAG: hypothetical protein IJ379_10955 [Lachnospiraceae bacterium]|nr:hypothetical protein [Lachnospiraceae bacterium]
MREKLETIMLAVSICSVSIILLVLGMNMSTMYNTGKEEIPQESMVTSKQDDILGDMIQEFSMDSLQLEFAGVNILTWDEYYELSGIPVKEEYQRGIYGTLKEENWQMEEAAVLALKELQDLEELELEGAYLMMVLVNASSSQAVDIWRGYLCNYLAEEVVSNNKRFEYYIQVNAYTGEVLKLEKKEGGKEAQVLLDNTTKAAVSQKDSSIDYSAVPMCTLEEHFQLVKSSFDITSDQYKYGKDGYLSMEEAGLIVLKEIHRLFDEDMVGMKLVMSFSDGKWGGWLLNDYDVDNEKYKSYSFRMDARTGKIWWLTGGGNVNYTKKTSMTDAEIITNTRSLIKKYNIANVENVNWNKVTVYNAGGQIKELLEESKENPNMHIANYIEFYSDEGELMRISTDWETGKLWMVLNKSYWYLYE